jgi:hypothetical protein
VDAHVRQRAPLDRLTQENAMATDNASPAAWPWASADPSAWLRTWSSAMQAVPQKFDQSINPGWSFGPSLTINSGNSSAPQTEVEVLQRHSYGRQLGRISEVLEALISERGKTAPADPRYASFLTMKAQIDEVKLDAAAARVDALAADLAALKTGRPAEYERLRSALRKIVAA